jgi:hypothetical protein
MEGKTQMMNSTDLIQLIAGVLVVVIIILVIQDRWNFKEQDRDK